MIATFPGILSELGRVEVEVSKPTETQSVQVRGTRNMLSEKKKDADWY